MFDFRTLEYTPSHLYSVAALGCKMKSATFNSRQSAKEYMYKYLDRKGIQVKEKWHDGHYVTYVCSDNIKVFINRI